MVQANKAAYIGRLNNSFELPNPLHKYASYNTLFTLSGLTENELREGRYLIEPVHDVIARSGGIGDAGIRASFRDKEIERFAKGGDSIRNILRVDELKAQQAQYADSISVLERNHDVFIENVNMVSTIAPNTERNLSNFTKMDFEVHEPYSITFIEKIRAATFNSGFLDYQDAPLLLTIEFKGFDENGKALRNGMSETRKIPILIARVEFDVNEGGARYNVVAVPYSDVAFDDRFKAIRSSFDLTVWQVGFNTPGGFKEKFEKALDDQMTQEIEEGTRQLPDKYRVEVDDDLLNNQLWKYAFTVKSLYGGKAVDDLEQQIQQDLNPGGFLGGEHTQTVTDGTTVNKALEDWLRNHPGFFDIAQDFWRAYLTMAGETFSDDEEKRIREIREFLTDKKNETKLAAIFMEHQYVPWFKIKTTVFTDTKRLDRVTKMHPKEIVYKAIPYKIHVLKLLSAGLSIGQVRWDKLVRKNYDFIYTGDNVDVQNLRIFYKAAYYMRNVRGDDDTENESGIARIIGNIRNLVFGEEDYPEPLLPLRQYPSNIKGRSTVKNYRKGGNKAQEFYDYLTNPEQDMMRIELDILGDPHYICADVLSCLKRINDKKTEQIIKIKADFDENQFGSFNGDQYMALINVRYRLPADINEKDGTMFAKEKFRDENLFFNGVYEVVKVDSKFNQGQFTQTLTCVRMNNQQGLGTAPNVVASSAFNSKYFKEDKKTDDKKGKGNIDDQLGNLDEITGS